MKLESCINNSELMDELEVSIEPDVSASFDSYELVDFHDYFLSSEKHKEVEKSVDLENNVDDEFLNIFNSTFDDMHTDSVVHDAYVQAVIVDKISSISSLNLINQAVVSFQDDYDAPNTFIGSDACNIGEEK